MYYSFFFFFSCLTFLVPQQLWTDEKSRRFIEKEYPWFLETFDSYKYPIQRADSIRYFVLAHYGGTYIDLDDVRLTFQPFQKDHGINYSVNTGLQPSIGSSFGVPGLVASHHTDWHLQ